MKARAELFDMAVNRAATYASRFGALREHPDPDELVAVLELWYLKTRFAYRIPLESVVSVLVRYPGAGHHWAGGPEGEWRAGENPRP